MEEHVIFKDTIKALLKMGFTNQFLAKRFPFRRHLDMINMFNHQGPAYWARVLLAYQSLTTIRGLRQAGFSLRRAKILLGKTAIEIYKECLDTLDSTDKPVDLTYLNSKIYGLF